MKKLIGTVGHLAFAIATRESMKLPGTTKDFMDFETYRMEYRPALTDAQWLWLAQLDAVHCSMQHGPRARDAYEYEQDRRWIESREDHIGSFEWVCKQFAAFNAEAIREALLAIKPSQVRRYAVRPTAGNMGPRPTVNEKKPRGKLAAHCPRAA